MQYRKRGVFMGAEKVNTDDVEYTSKVADPSLIRAVTQQLSAKVDA